MRILKLEFENLNSLKGHWEIDFTHPDYQKNHDIFVIHGSTGAGKTTILDAITLALYARTPRQPAVNDGVGGNELMTRGTGICFSKVTYKCKNGLYISEFQQNRANGKAAGKLQKASFKISKIFNISNDDDSMPSEPQVQVIAAGTAANLGAETKKIIQLDYNQFCRSIMLAQGEFNKFLTCDERARAEILEKLTGTERYREIGQKICDKFSQIKKDYNEKKAQRAEIQDLILTEEAEDQIIKQEKKLRKEAAEKQKQIERILTELNFFDELDRLSKALEAAQSEEKEVEKEALEFANDAEKLSLGQSAQKCEAEYIKVSNLRNAQKTDLEQIESLKNQISLADEAFIQEQEKTAQIKNELENEEKDLNVQQKVWKKVRELDIQLKNLQTSASQAKEKLDEAENAVEQDKLKQEALKESIKQLEEKQKTISAYLEENKNDEKLTAAIAKIEALQSGAEGQAKIIQELKTKEALLLEELDKAQSQVEAVTAEVAQVEEEIKKFVSADAVMIARILKGQLAAGKPCPVCGSLYHQEECSQADDRVADDQLAGGQLAEGQFAGGRDLAESESAGKESQRIALTSSNLMARRDALLAQLQKATAARDAHQSDLTHTKESLAAGLSALDAALKQIEEVLTPWQESLTQAVSLTSLPALLQTLRQKSTLWAEQSAAATDCESQLAGLTVEGKAAGLNLAAHTQTLEKAQSENAAAQEALAQAGKERAELFGSRDPDREEAEKKAHIQSLKEAYEGAADTQNKAREQKARLEAQSAQLLGAVEKRGPLVSAAEGEFAAKLEEAQFGSEQAFVGARLPAPLLAELSAKKDALNTRKTQAKTSLKNAEQSYKDFQASSKISKDKAQLLQEQTELSALKEELDNQLIDLNSKLKNNEQNKKQAQKLQSEYEAIQKEYEVWEQMKKWVGKDDGSDLSVFVQSLAFNRLLNITNKNLFEITKRYKIVQKAPLSLDFEINDIYFPENRSIKTLSGGEQFLVSLSLALGISAFASQNVSVDSLFLDEGFGTLSGELLEEVILALKNLQKENKMLGIITHVQEVISEIDQRIEVKPTSAGYSQLIGSGISQLA